MLLIPHKIFLSTILLIILLQEKLNLLGLIILQGQSNTE